MKKLAYFSMLLAAFLFVFAACNKDDEETTSGTSSLGIKLTSSNSMKSTETFDAVFVDVLQISYHTSDDATATDGWIDINTDEGIYNLMEYFNNEALIAFDEVVDPQTISQIRILLGENNTVVDEGDTYDLETPSAQSSGIKVQVHLQMEAGASYEIMLDFDAEESVKKIGNDTYKLQPVIQSTVTQL